MRNERKGEIRATMIVRVAGSRGSRKWKGVCVIVRESDSEAPREKQRDGEIGERGRGRERTGRTEGTKMKKERVQRERDRQTERRYTAISTSPFSPLSLSSLSPRLPSPLSL
jgi:hypothetical protein